MEKENALCCGRMCRGSSILRTTLLEIFSQRLPGKSNPCTHQGLNGRTQVVCLDPKETYTGGFWTLNISECPNDAEESFLSQVLENQTAEKYFLSDKAKKGILSRAERRKKTLPPLLKAALEQTDNAYALDCQHSGNTNVICINGNIINKDPEGTSGGNGLGVISDGTVYTLLASDVHAVATPTMQVRRLTPVECERLQGMPDNHTRIPWRGKPAEDCPDGLRYKAIGNSMAVPVMRWIGKRMVATISAFDLV